VCCGDSGQFGQSMDGRSHSLRVAAVVGPIDRNVELEGENW
jgi:hypothetical protein